MNTFFFDRLLKLFWLLFGSIVLLVSSPGFYSVFGFSFFNKSNIFQFFLVMIFRFIGVFFLPILFVLFSFFVKKRWYSAFFLVFAFLLELLNALWFYKSWSYGLRYQGEHFTIMIALINVLCFAMVLLLTWLGVKYKKRVFLHIATLAFFVTLAFIAFPWLGESI